MRNSTKLAKPEAAKSRGRGRPRGFDPETALAQARDVFWEAGYAGTSLDDLSAAMAMNRPSVYAAFGDKEALYLKTLEGYRDAGAAAMAAALDPKRPLGEGLAAVYAGAIALYLAGPNSPRGCFLIGTAAAEAVTRKSVRDFLAGALAGFDAAFETRLRQAIAAGELPKGSDAMALARLAGAIMHSLAVRARAGATRKELEALADAGVRAVCGAASAHRRRN